MSDFGGGGVTTSATEGFRNRAGLVFSYVCCIVPRRMTVEEVRQLDKNPGRYERFGGGDDDG
jgi:hypothetical protein